MDALGKFVDRINANIKSNSRLFNIAVAIALICLVPRLVGIIWHTKLFFQGGGLILNEFTPAQLMISFGGLVLPFCAVYLLLSRNKSLFWVVVIPFAVQLFSIPNLISSIIISEQPSYGIALIFVYLIMSGAWVFLVWLLVKRGELK